MSHAGQADAGGAALRVVLLGNDAIAAVAPATPVQLMHACRSAGFDVVVPPNWGDELVAMEALRQLDGLGRQPAVLVACPLVAARIEALPGGPDMALVATVAPPVAAARHLRRLAAGAPMHLTFVGGCPEASQGEIDGRFTPDEFLAALLERGIVVAEQPELFEDMLPPDRRRWVSLPGGVPMPAAVARRGGHILIELDGIHAEAAARWRNAARGSGVVDAAAGLGCSCSGALPGRGGSSARARVAACDPPRARAAVIVELPGINLQRRVTVPAAPAVAVAARGTTSRGTPTAATAVLDAPGGGGLATPPAPPERPPEPPTAAPAPPTEPAEPPEPRQPTLAAPMPVTHTPPRSMHAIVLDAAAPAAGAPTPASAPAATPASAPGTWLSRPLPMHVRLPVMIATIVVIGLLARLTRADDATRRVSETQDGDVRMPTVAAPAPRPRVAAPAPPPAARTPATRTPVTRTPAARTPVRAPARAQPVTRAATRTPDLPVTAPVTTLVAPTVAPPVARETTVTPAPRPAVDSAALERAAIRRELDARRNRLDSIQRRIDSLYRVRRPPG